jgi:hypothetical protein
MSQIGILSLNLRCVCGAPLKAVHGDDLDIVVTPCECRLRERLAETCEWEWWNEQKVYLPDCSENTYRLLTQHCPDCGRIIEVKKDAE